MVTPWPNLCQNARFQSRILPACGAPTGQLKQELRGLVQKSVGKIVVVDDIDFVDVLPETRSDKIMRRLIKAVISGQPLRDYSTMKG